MRTALCTIFGTTTCRLRCSALDTMLSLFKLKKKAWVVAPFVSEGSDHQLANRRLDIAKVWSLLSLISKTSLNKTCVRLDLFHGLSSMLFLTLALASSSSFRKAFRCDICSVISACKAILVAISSRHSRCLQSRTLCSKLGKTCDPAREDSSLWKWLRRKCSDFCPYYCWMHITHYTGIYMATNSYYLSMRFIALLSLLELSHSTSNHQDLAPCGGSFFLRRFPKHTHISNSVHLGSTMRTGSTAFPLTLWEYLPLTEISVSCYRKGWSIIEWSFHASVLSHSSFIHYKVRPSRSQVSYDLKCYWIPTYFIV